MAAGYFPSGPFEVRRINTFFFGGTNVVATVGVVSGRIHLSSSGSVMILSHFVPGVGPGKCVEFNYV